MRKYTEKASRALRTFAGDLHLLRNSYRLLAWAPERS